MHDRKRVNVTHPPEITHPAAHCRASSRVLDPGLCASKPVSGTDQRPPGWDPEGLCGRTLFASPEFDVIELDLSQRDRRCLHHPPTTAFGGGTFPPLRWGTDLLLQPPLVALRGD